MKTTMSPRYPGILVPLVTLLIAGCGHKGRTFFEAAQEAVQTVFSCSLLHGVQAPIDYSWVFSDLPGENPLPADFTVQGTWSYSAPNLSLEFPDAPQPITGPCDDATGNWGPAGTGLVEFQPSAFAEERYLNARFLFVSDQIFFSADSEVDFTGAIEGRREFQVTGSYMVP